MGERLKFWMVWRERTPTTKHQHLTKDEAEREAKRLAKVSPGETIYVLKTVEAFSSKETPVQRHKLNADLIPF